VGTSISRPLLRAGKVIGLFCGASVLITLLSCGSSTSTSTGPSQVPAKCDVQAQLERSSFPPPGGTGSLQVTTNRECSWTANSDAAWLTLSSQPSGQGDATIQFTVAANNDPSTRTAGISVNDRRMQISQDGKPCGFTLSSTSEQVDPGGGDRTVQVSASSGQCTWNATANAPWIAITAGGSGKGPGSVAFHVLPSDGPPRSGTVTIAGLTVNVLQGVGCNYQVDPSSYAAPASGGSVDLNVQSGAGCPWSASSTADWVVIEGASTGSGPGRVRATVSPWAGIGRTAMVHVADRTVTITQASGCTVAVSPSSATVGAAAGSTTIQVNTAAGCAWQAASTVPWITIAGSASGTGAATLPLAIAANTAIARQGTVTIGEQTVTISQASGCTFSIAPQDQDAPPSGTQGSVSVTTGEGCAWTASSSDAWVTFASSSGAGAGAATFTVATNSGPPRNTTLTIAGHPFTVRQQSACTWTFSPPYMPLDASGGNGNVLVIVAGTCTWDVVNHADWITVTAGQSGAGNGLLQFVVPPNPGPARTGILTIAGLDYTVTQSGR